MDIEFHYYYTFLIARRAGFSHDEAAILAHASQGVDDNHVPITVNAGQPSVYQNSISQTMDILRPHDDAHIYPVFHFVPGDPTAPTAARGDTTTNPMVSTPDAPIAKAMIQAALNSDDLYRIGVASHVYVDTWAHQNFLGQRSDFNILPVDGLGPNDIEQVGADLAINVGHGPAQHRPDIPALIWTDGRLVNSTVNNRDRFLDAAEALFRRYAEAKKIPSSDIEAGVTEIRSDLTADIGNPDPNAQAMDPARIARYMARATTPAYGGQAIPDYQPNAWFEAALQEDRNGVVSEFKAKIDSLANEFGDYSDLIRQDIRINCNWASPNSFQATNWYRFQEAVKAHYAETWKALLGAGLVAV